MNKTVDLERIKFERASYKDRFSKIWYQSRIDIGRSQEYMANGLGVSRKTIQNWEKGKTSPDLFQATEWFRLLGLNPMSYYISYLYPNTDFKDIKDNDDKIKQKLINMLNELSSLEIRELAFIMSGAHGSSWHSLLQMLTAHCHTTLRDRVVMSKVIKDNYLMCRALGLDPCPEAPQPDIAILKKAYKEAAASILSNKNEYTIL